MSIETRLRNAKLALDRDPNGEWVREYPTMASAMVALCSWDGEGDPPGPWIKLKGHPDGERLGPGATSEEVA